MAELIEEPPRPFRLLMPFMLEAMLMLMLMEEMELGDVSTGCDVSGLIELKNGKFFGASPLLVQLL